MRRWRFDLDDLHAMVAVVEQGGFRAAALALNLSQPALSRRVSKLEGAIKVQRRFSTCSRSCAPIG
jgi:DNA-binding transcriptional LysR family regulator